MKNQGFTLLELLITISILASVIVLGSSALMTLSSESTALFTTHRIFHSLWNSRYQSLTNDTFLSVDSFAPLPPHFLTDYSHTSGIRFTDNGTPSYAGTLTTEYLSKVHVVTIPAGDGKINFKR